MSSRHLQVLGIKELTNQLVRIGGVGGLKILASASRAALKPALEKARERVPVDSGDLKKSLRVAIVKPKSGNVVCSAGLVVTRRKVRDEVAVYGSEGELLEFERTSRVIDAGWRWHFVEFGSVHNKPTPFLRPSFEENVDRALAILTDRLKKAISKAIEEGGSTPVGYGPGGAFPRVGETEITWYDRGGTP